tara:strand:+ start:809 stop:1252 length:444 start_codon:yes stop_codon:yes gene_type:complete
MNKSIRFSIGADNNSNCVLIAKKYLTRMNYETKTYGSLNKDSMSWVEVAEKVALDVQKNSSDFGILFCYTGTGVTIVANKFKGIRAALCNNTEIAIGARKWNDANILSMSTLTVKDEDIENIIALWIETKVDKSEMKNIEKISGIEV